MIILPLVNKCLCCGLFISGGTFCRSCALSKNKGTQMELPLKTPKESITEEAERIINSDRRNDYGPAENSFKQIAKIWSGLLNHEITDKQVAIMMAAFKLYRESVKTKRDNSVDAIGYILLLDKINNSQP